MTIKKLFATLFVSALLAVGCGDTNNVTNNYTTEITMTPDGGAGTATTNNYYNTSLDGGATTVTNNTTNNYGVALDGGTTINVNVNVAVAGAASDGGAAQSTDSQPQTVSPTTPSAPANPDIAMLAMKGGEKMLDTANGIFAWVAADGALTKFNSLTGTVTQLNTPQPGSSENFRYFDKVLALAVDVSGSVFWIYQHDYTQDSKSFAKIVVQRDQDTSTPVDSKTIDVSTHYPLGASIATSGYALGYVGAILPLDNSNNYEFGWYDLANGGTYAKGAAATAKYSGTVALSNLRIHSNIVGFKMRDQYITVSLSNPTSTTNNDVIYTAAADFGGTSVLYLRAYMGKFWVNKNDTTNPYIGSQFDQGSLSNLNCTRCVALGANASVAVWTVNNGLHYQVADRQSQFIPGVNEFALSNTGMKLYYFGFDRVGGEWLFSRDL